MEKSQIRKPILPLLISNWIFGVGIIEYPIGTPRPIMSFIYSTTLFIIYCTTVIIVRPEIFNISIVLEKNSMPLNIIYNTNILFTISIVTLGWYRSKGLCRYIAKAAVADNLMEQIGIRNNYGKMLRVVVKRVVIGYLFIMLLIASFCVIILVGDSPLHLRIIVSVAMSYPVLIIFTSDTMFVSCVRCACYRFTKLNKVLESMLTSTHDLPQHKRIYYTVPESNSENAASVIDNVSQRKNLALVVNLAKEIHLQLINACQEIDHIYGLHLLLSITFAFAVITGNMYMCYMTIIDKSIPHSIKVKTLAALGLWIVYYGLKISYFSSICSCCTANSVKTGYVINELYDEPSTTIETKLKIRQFNMQLIQQPCKFTAWGFVNIDCHLIQVMAGSIITYLMILIQLRNTTYVSDNSYTKYLKSFNNSNLLI